MSREVYSLTLLMGITFTEEAFSKKLARYIRQLNVSTCQQIFSHIELILL